MLSLPPDEKTSPVFPIESLNKELIMQWFKLIQPKENGFTIYATRPITAILKEHLCSDANIDLETWLKNEEAWLMDGAEDDYYDVPILWLVYIRLHETYEARFLIDFWFNSCNQVTIIVENQFDNEIREAIGNHYEKEAGLSLHKDESVTWDVAIKKMQAIVKAHAKQIPGLPTS